MLNSAILMGRLTTDPDLRQTPSGVSVATFSLAVNRNYNKDQTDFITIVAWRQTADFVGKYFKKGRLVAVEGSIQTRSYTDKQGNKRTAVEVVADQVYFAESSQSKFKGDNGGSESQGVISQDRAENADTGFTIGNLEEYEEIDTDDGDLPF